MKLSKNVEFGITKPFVFTKLKTSQKVSFNKSYWLDKNKYFFKYLSEPVKDAHYIVGEVLVSQLCKELGVKCIDAGYAINDLKISNHIGVISKNFLHQNEESITIATIKERELIKKFSEDFYKNMMKAFSHVCPITMLKNQYNLVKVVSNLLYKYGHNSKMLTPSDKTFIKENLNALKILYEQLTNNSTISIEKCLQLIANYSANNGFIFNNEDIRFELQKMAIIDALTKQVDRHLGNISLILNKNTKTIKLAPMYDNGKCEYIIGKKSICQYPNCCDWFLQLTKEDLKQINNPQTKIHAFYKKVCQFYNNGLEVFALNFQNQLNEMKKHQEEHNLTKFKISSAYTDIIKSNYKTGLDYIETELKKVTKNNNKTNQFCNK